MKRSKPDPILDERLGLRPPEVVRILGSEQIFHEVCEVGWLQPVVQRHRLTLYDANAVKRVWRRIVSGEDPREYLKR
ncbi:hypothetical protein OAV21_01615 [bacterium]|jgi:hypothetical protein|nr:hypothetical protein [bacterium]MDF1789636.1 hypothetical protein [Verrucomicrobiales bacterium]